MESRFSFISSICATSRPRSRLAQRAHKSAEDSRKIFSLLRNLRIGAMVDVIERIEVMLKQEDSSYKTYDYLAPEYQQKLTSCDGSFCASSSSENSSHSSGGINESWREKICEWSYQVIDHFDFSREVVMVAMNFLDRYLASRAVNKKVFQLAAMTALFLAIKLNEPGKLTMASMIELSRGYFTVDQMVAMEISILR